MQHHYIILMTRYVFIPESLLLAGLAGEHGGPGNTSLDDPADLVVSGCCVGHPRTVTETLSKHVIHLMNGKPDIMEEFRLKSDIARWCENFVDHDNFHSEVQVEARKLFMTAP